MELNKSFTLCRAKYPKLQGFLRRQNVINFLSYIYNQYQYLLKQVSKNGWRTHEPLDDEFMIPQPTLLYKAIELLVDQNIMSKKDLLYILQ